MRKGLLIATTALLATLAQGVSAADLPKATQKALAGIKADAAVLAGLDDELKVPQAWLDAAATEKEVIIFGTWNDREFSAMTAPFKERYPFVTVKYNRTGTAGRGVKVLVALNEGRILADVLTSIADATPQFIEAKALANLRELPTFNSLSSDYVAADGTWASFKLSFRCMAYNTEKVKASDLPKTWEDLLTAPIWRKGNLAISDHPNAWMLNLWGGKGEQWGQDFMRRLFQEVQPQRRKEGMTQMTALTVAGEFHANLPSPEWVAQRYKVKGAPIGYHCPAPVPITLSQIVMLEKSPRKHAASLFINWMLSREGQLLQYTETFAVPVHKGMQSEKFLPFAETITGKPALVRSDALLGDEMQKTMQKSWNGYWSAIVDGKTGEKPEKPAGGGDE